MCRLDDEVRNWREDLQLFREYARSEVPVWRSVLLTGWVLYALSLLLPGFGIVAFQRSSPSFGVPAAGWEFLWLALRNGWIVELLPNLGDGHDVAATRTDPAPDGGVGGASPRSSCCLRPRIRGTQSPAPASGNGRWRSLHVRTSRSRLLGLGRVVRACSHRPVVARQRVGRRRTEKVVRLASETAGRPDTTLSPVAPTPHQEMRNGSRPRVP